MISSISCSFMFRVFRVFGDFLFNEDQDQTTQYTKQDVPHSESLTARNT